jgi:hypothetical protein
VVLAASLPRLKDAHGSQAGTLEERGEATVLGAHPRPGSGIRKRSVECVGRGTFTVTGRTWERAVVAAENRRVSALTGLRVPAFLQ